MSERGIYELSVWVAGMRALPAPRELPDCIKLLGFSKMPDKEGLKVRWKQLAKVAHPDSGGDPDYFRTIKAAYEQAVELAGEEGRGVEPPSI